MKLAACLFIFGVGISTGDSLHGLAAGLMSLVAFLIAFIVTFRELRRMRAEDERELRP